MAGEWTVLPLEDCMDAVIDYRGKTPRKTAFGIPLITAKVVKSGRIEPPNEFVSVADYEVWMRRGLPKAGDVVVTTEAPLGEVGQLGTERVALAQRLIALRGKAGVLANDFLKFLMQSEAVQKQLQSRASGSTVLGIKQSELRKVALRLPPLPEQLAIANILGTLDDKIELNRRMNETLEAIAGAIFKSWFVDFDPVRARAGGEPPESICRRLGLTPDLLALFPDRLVDSELGEIPEGWAVQPLVQITSYLSRGISPKYIEAGGVLVLNQKCVRDGRVDVSKARRHDPAQRHVAGRLLQIGDVLVNSTGVGTLGRLAQVLNIEEPTIVDSHVTVVRADPGQVSWNYLGVALHGREAEIERLGEGSTGQTELSRVRLGAFPLLLPPKPLRDHFDDTVLSLRLRTKRNDEQNVTLASVRDTLIPKLLSGEFRVPAEDFVPEPMT